MEPTIRFELMASSLPRKCSTTELRGLTLPVYASIIPDFPRHAGILYGNNSPNDRHPMIDTHVLERETGLEPATNSLESYDSTS